MSWRSRLTKWLMGAAIAEGVQAEVPKFEVEFLIDRKVSLIDLVHTHQEYEMSFSEFATAIATTSTGSSFVSAGSPFGFTPRFRPLKRI